MLSSRQSGVLDLRTQPTVVVNVFVTQRLLHHEQIEVVHRLEEGGVGQGEGGVGIEHDGHAGESFAGGAGQFEIPAGLDFEFDTAVSLPQMPFNHRQRPRDRRLNADADTDLDPLFWAFRVRLGQLLGKRESIPLGGDVPGGLIHGGFGQRMTAHGRHPANHILWFL